VTGDIIKGGRSNPFSENSFSPVSVRCWYISRRFLSRRPSCGDDDSDTIPSRPY
jgi:hypothetical protein